MTGGRGDRPAAADRPAFDDVVESPPARSDAVRERWSALPRAQRVAIGGVLLAALGGGIVAYGVGEVRAVRTERALDDQVAISAAMGISSTSSSPPGGRVDFFVTVENTGTRPVSITSVDITVPRLHITDDGIRIRQLPPAATMLVPLSVILDCTAPPGAVTGGQPGPVEPAGTWERGLIEAVPPNGRSRTVEVAVSQLDVVTGIADTLCVDQPDVRDLELDGPVL